MLHSLKVRKTFLFPQFSNSNFKPIFSFHFGACDVILTFNAYYQRMNANLSAASKRHFVIHVRYSITKITGGSQQCCIEKEGIGNICPGTPFKLSTIVKTEKYCNKPLIFLKMLKICVGASPLHLK